MASRAHVEVSYNYPAIAALTTEVAYKAAHKAAEATKHRAQRFAPKRSGVLAATITVEVKGIAGPVTTFIIKTDNILAPYGLYQELGTGPITPRTAKVLSFTVGGKRVFTMRTRGVPATHFMSRAALYITEGDFA